MKKIKLIKILAGFFVLMLLFTFLSRAADSVNVAQVETKTAQNQVIAHEVTGTGKVMGTRERAVFTQEGQQKLYPRIFKELRAETAALISQNRRQSM